MRTITASAAALRQLPNRVFSSSIMGAVTIVVAVFIAAPAAVPAASLASKQAQAAALDRQVSVLEDRYGELQERWRGALVELREVRGEMLDARAELKVARRDLQKAKVRLEERVVAIYRDGGNASQLQQVATAGSIEDFFARLETIDRVGTQDAVILEKVRAAALAVSRQEQRLAEANKKQSKVVKRADREKRKMQSVLTKKEKALQSVTAEIRAIMEAQRAAAAAADAQRARSAAEAYSGGGDDSAAVDAGGDVATESPSSSSGISVPLPPASGVAASAASIAVGKSGSPYSYGAAGPSSFDCSGLVVWAFAQAGRSGLPHSTYSLIGMGVDVPLSQAQVGDLVFTNNSGHMGIYVGGGSFVHAPRTGRTVTVESLGNYSVVAVRRI